MKPFTTASALLAILLISGPLTAEEPSGDPIEGARIAAELKAMRPATNTQWTGVLKRRLASKVTVEVPVACHIFIEADRWLSVYNSSATGNGPAEKLVVIRHGDGRTEYNYWKAPNGVELPEQPRQLAGTNAAIPFAGSDFLLSDLGIEFLQWPMQLLQSGEMRRGQPCYVLDSINPNPGKNGYARVRSWIAKEFLGMLQAEAYDVNGRKVKEFYAGSMAKDSFGNYQLKEMEITSFVDRTRSKLEFDVTR